MEVDDSQLRSNAIPRFFEQKINVTRGKREEEGKEAEEERERGRGESWEAGVAYKLLTFNLNQVGREKFQKLSIQSSYKRRGQGSAYQLGLVESFRLVGISGGTGALDDDRFEKMNVNMQPFSKETFEEFRS